MNESIAMPDRTQTRSFIRYTLLLVVLLGLGLLAYRAWSAQQTTEPDSATAYLSEPELAERYGLSVRLIGVTAGGGLVDLRLKVLDADKAQMFLQDPANLPRLVAARSGDALLGTQGLEDDVRWEEGGVLFILFSNSGGVIKPGEPVSVEFGRLQLEPILAQ